MFMGTRGVADSLRADQQRRIAQMERELELMFPGGCLHEMAVPVEVCTGEIVARLCPGCDTQLAPLRKS